MASTTSIIEDLKFLLELAPPSANDQTHLLMELGSQCIEKDEQQAAFELFNEAQSRDHICEQAFVGMSIAMLGTGNRKTSRKLLAQASTLHQMVGDGNRADLYASALRQLDDTSENTVLPRRAEKENAVLKDQLLARHPPLILDDAKICMLFSPKCGCTTVTKWVLHHLGLLDAAIRYNSWPHSFRVEVLYPSAQYQALIESLVVRDYTYYLVVRNPYRRLLSAFCHFGLRQQLLHEAAFCDDTVSFREFATAICRDTDFAVNAHVTPQYTKQRANLEKSIEIKRIKIEDGLMEQLADIERIHDLPNPIAGSSKSSISQSFHHARYEASETERGAAAADRAIHVDYKGAFGPPEAYFDDELLELIYQCYESDFVHCGYRRGEL